MSTERRTFVNVLYTHLFVPTTQLRIEQDTLPLDSPQVGSRFELVIELVVYICHFAPQTKNSCTAKVQAILLFELCWLNLQHNVACLPQNGDAFILSLLQGVICACRDRRTKVSLVVWKCVV